MRLLKTLLHGAGLGLCVVAFTGTALADPGNGNGGPATTPPGQEQKAATPAAAPAATPAPQAAAGQARKAANKPAAAPKPTPRGQAKKAQNQAKKAAKKAAKQPVATASHSGSDTKGRSADAHHHVVVCHATGSASNPFVVINIPLTAWNGGHSGHGDRLLKDPASAPGTKDGFDKSDCESATPSSATTLNRSSEQSNTTCPATVTTTEQVLVGVKHFTGATKDGERKFVLISPSEQSAHLNGKHPDDVPVYETRTVTRSFSGENCAAVVSTNTSSTSGIAPTATDVLTAGAAVPATDTATESVAAPVGGVAGAVSPAPAGPTADAKPEGGVLGAVASAPEAIAETATGNLPFTGIPLWVAALLGTALLAAGLTLRRST